MFNMPNDKLNKAGKIPTFLDYALDLPLKQFRKVLTSPNDSGFDIEFIEWDSELGRSLLLVMLHNPHLIKTYRGESQQEILNEVGKKVFWVSRPSVS